MGRWLTDLADVVRATGWPVIEVDDWQTRARGGTGGHGTDGYQPAKPDHVMIHHTASPPSADGWDDVNYCTFHDDDAPLCNLYLARDGTWYICAAGATNCNGSGSDPCHLIDDDTMNPAAVAVEAGNNGTGETWPAAQLDSYLAGVAALCDAYGIPTSRVHAHWEYAPGRKVDPLGPARYAQGAQSWHMDAFRADITTPEPTPEPEPEPEDDDMANRALLISSGGGSQPGAVAVADYALRAKTFVTGEDAQALNQTGQYDWITLAGATFDAIPGTEAIDIVE